MTYAVVLVVDSAGACPVILRDDSEPLPGGEGVRYRLVASTDDHAEAVRVVELLKRRASDWSQIENVVELHRLGSDLLRRLDSETEREVLRAILE